MEAEPIRVGSPREQQERAAAGPQGLKGEGRDDSVWSPAGAVQGRAAHGGCGHVRQSKVDVGKGWQTSLASGGLSLAQPSGTPEGGEQGEQFSGSVLDPAPRQRRAARGSRGGKVEGNPHRLCSSSHYLCSSPQSGSQIREPFDVHPCSGTHGGERASQGHGECGEMGGMGGELWGALGSR